MRHADVLEHEPPDELRMSGGDAAGDEAAQGVTDQVERVFVELPSRPATSSAIAWIEYRPGQSLSPCPRRLTAWTVLDACSDEATTSQSSPVSPVPGSSTTGGRVASVAGHTRTRRVTPSTATSSCSGTDAASPRGTTGRKPVRRGRTPHCDCALSPSVSAPPGCGPPGPHET